MIRKILRAWCDFLRSPASLYVINDSPRGWKCASARKATRIEEFQYKPREEALGLHVLERLLHPAIQAGRPADRRARRRQGDRQRLRIDAVRAQDEREAAGPVLDQGPALFAAGHAGRRRVGRRVRRRDGLPGIPRRPQLSPLAQPGVGHDPQGVRPRRGPTTPRPSRKARTPRARTGRRATWRTSRPGRSSSSRATIR